MPAGSGIAFHYVYVSDNGGDYRALAGSRRRTTSAPYTGQPGHTYRFYSMAQDNVGNLQPTPATVQATTTVGGIYGQPPARPGGHAGRSLRGPGRDLAARLLPAPAVEYAGIANPATSAKLYHAAVEDLPLLRRQARRCIHRASVLDPNHAINSTSADADRHVDSNTDASSNAIRHPHQRRRWSRTSRWAREAGKQQQRGPRWRASAWPEAGLGDERGPITQFGLAGQGEKVGGRHLRASWCRSAPTSTTWPATYMMELQHPGQAPRRDFRARHHDTAKHRAGNVVEQQPVQALEGNVVATLGGSGSERGECCSRFPASSAMRGWRRTSSRTALEVSLVFHDGQQGGGAGWARHFWVIIIRQVRAAARSLEHLLDGLQQ